MQENIYISNLMFVSVVVVSAAALIWCAYLLGLLAQTKKHVGKMRGSGVFSAASTNKSKDKNLNRNLSNAGGAFGNGADGNNAENSVKKSGLKLLVQKITRRRNQNNSEVDVSRKNWVLFQLAVCVIVFIASVLAGSAIMGIILCVGVFVGCFAYRTFEAHKQQFELEKQIHQLEIQMSENSRSGLSVERSLRACLEHSEKPIKEYLERMINELTYSNATLSDVFRRFASDSDSNDAQLLSSVIDVQQETGSNLADTLDFLAESISEKQKMRQTLRSRIAEMRLTKIIVAISPIVIVGICCLTISGVTEFYTSNPLGWILLAICALGECMGIFILNKMSDMKIY